MDQKMDSGYLEPGETMEDDYNFDQALLPEEVVGIIDQIFCHEVLLFFSKEDAALLTYQMAWHMGHPLAQSVFTSLYIDRLLSSNPSTVEQATFHETHPSDENFTLQILRAYCIGLIKTCFYINARVKSEHYYEVRIASIPPSRKCSSLYIRKRTL